MMINNHFDLAALVGKQAYHYLLLADNAYRKAEKSNLFDPTLHNPAKCLSLSGSIDSLRREELTYCILAVILFQSMMEKIPVFVPTIGSGMELTKKSKFAPAWEDLISRITDSVDKSAAKSVFAQYKEEIYWNMRLPIVHGKEKIDLDKINSIRITDVYAGFRKGWEAYDYLLKEVFAPEQAHHPSWIATFGDHFSSVNLDESDFPDLNVLANAFRRRHLDWARALTDASKVQAE